MRSYNICTISSHALGDLSRALQEALQDLGCHAVYSERVVATDAKNIFLDSALIQDWTIVPKGSILYNLEQLNSGSSLVTNQYLEALSHYQVWDYSRKNIAFLKERGISAYYVPVGFARCLARPPVEVHKDVDILFYGSLNERRSAVIDRLRTFASVAAVTGVYGNDLFALISRAKIVLNLHFYESSIFESVRVSYLLANKKAVVTEVNADTEFPAHYQGTVCEASYQDIPEACQRLLANELERKTLETDAFRIFSSHPQRAFLRDAIDDSITVI